MGKNKEQVFFIENFNFQNVQGRGNNSMNGNNTPRRSRSRSSRKKEENKTTTTQTASLPQPQEGIPDRTPGKALSAELLAHAIEACQQYFWGKSSYAVLYCIIRDDFEQNMSRAAFERMVEMLPFTKNRDWICTEGTLDSAFRKNPYMSSPISKWEKEGVMERVPTLVEKLREELKG